MRIASPILVQAAVLLGTSLSLFAYPDLVKTAKPNPEPALPVGFDLFTPPVTAGSPSSTAPVFAEWTRTGSPNDTVVMTGDRFSTFTGLSQGKDTTFFIFGQTTASNQRLASGIIRRLDGNKAALKLDSGLPYDSMFLLWAGNQNGYSAPIPLNKTDAWWVGPERATRGATVSVYGRALSRYGTGNVSAVYVKPLGSFAGVWATVTAVNPYKVDFVVPSSLSNGSYEVWTHNTHGGHYGWSGPLPLTVDNGPAWTGQEYNVKNFGATGNGTTDDRTAIIAGLTYAAARPESTLYFPAGVYKTTDYLTIPSNVRLRGDGRDATSIKLSVVSAVSPPIAAIYIAGSNMEIRDLTLAAAGNLPTDPQNYVFILLSAQGTQDLRFTNVRMSGLGCDTFDMVEPRRLFFKDCEFIGHNGYLETAGQVFFAGCSFLQTNDAAVPVWAYSGKDISLTGCSTRDLDNSNSAKGDGWGLGRWFVGNGYFGAQRHVYLGDNTSTNLGVRPGATNQNSGEQFLWELPNYYFAGPVAAAAATSATLTGYKGNNDNFFSGQNDDSFDCEVIVVEGKGLGQHRALATVNRTTGVITIAQPWNVIPDTSSKVVIMTASEKVAVYHNSLDGKPYVYQQEPHIASSGVQAFEGALDFVVDGNSFHEIRNAISLWGYSELHENKPVYFGTYVNNLIESNRWGVKWMAQSPNIGVNFLGNVFRGNTLRGIVFDGFAITSDPGTNPKPWVDLNVIERTAGTNLPLGITHSGAPGSMLNTMMLFNSFTRGSASFSGSKAFTFLANEIPCLRGNGASGFEKIYAGVLPGPTMETPFRVIAVDAFASAAAKTASLDVWDAGTAPLTWNASSDSSWLKLASTAGTVLSENAVNTVSFMCDPQGLSIGTYTGNITLTGSGQTKVVKVSFLIH